MEKGALPNAKNDEGATPLHIAMFNQDIEVARTLIAAGARLDITDNSGRTPPDYLKIYSDKFNPKIYELLDPALRPK